MTRVGIAGLVLLLAGCSTIGSMGSSVGNTVGGWFGAGSTKAKPAELVEIKSPIALAEAWTVDTGETGASLFQPTLMGEDVVAAGGDRVVRIAVANGKSVWRSDAGVRLSAGAGAGAGLVLAGSGKGQVVALDAANGQLRWQTALSSEVVGTLQVAGSMVIVRTGDGRLHGLDVADGSRKWLYSRNLPALTLRGSGGMSLSGDVLYIGFPGGKLVALNPANGAQLWEATVALPRGATELERVADVMGNPVVDDRQVCAVAYQGRVACFDKVTGAPLWARDASSNSGLAMDGQNLYVTDDKDAVTAYDKTSGRAGWRQDKLARRQVTAPLALGDLIVVGDGEGYVHVLSIEDGRFLGRARVDAAVRSAPVDIGPGFVVQTAKGSVVAFRLK
ncbi:MAG: outer membrane protein assembly factor BamB [Hydrogenophilales bacterium 16-64-46]|nr:MAG: outer membrane protein assembly factor BamB [Hydrogenophilales bacterium 12-64-13]OYZ06391.1 MAG: outer membrane protein assembly factor BamB [Hydrogenophilales bacterium 16-64-46]OZA39056.1 MAG: outer membrane protein assembly factor BamB [Hydrogenophilales bacterium 17-64-34]